MQERILLLSFNQVVANWKGLEENLFWPRLPILGFRTITNSGRIAWFRAL